MNHKVGYGFHPNEEEIIIYLKLKVLGLHSEVDDVIAEVDILEFEPSQLPAFSVTNSNGPWYFSCKPKYKSVNSNQVRRTTRMGFWKVTAQDRKVCTIKTGEQIGFKKILTFYEGRAANEKKTNWVIHEYHLPDQRAYVICRLKKKADKKAYNLTTPDEVESSFQGLFDDGNTSENTSLEDNPFLLSNLESLMNDGLLDYDLLDYDSPTVPQSQMVTEQGQTNQWLGDSSVDSSSNMPYQINCIQLATEEIPIHKSQYQSRSHKTVEEAVFELQGDFSSKVVIRDEVGEAAKQGTAIDLLKKENSSSKLSRNELASSDQMGFFTFMDTSQLSHSSNSPSVHLINTLLGIFLFYVVVRGVILFGDW